MEDLTKKELLALTKVNYDEAGRLEKEAKELRKRGDNYLTTFIKRVEKEEKEEDL